MLHVSGLTVALPLAAQAGALPAVAAFHDARWLFVFSDTWPVLGAELVAAFAVRVALNAACVRAAWPHRARPLLGRLLVRTAVAYGVLLVALSPWALLSMVTAVVSQAYPLIGGAIGAGVVMVLLLPRAGIERGWWCRFPPWRAIAWSAADLVVVTAAAVGIDYAPGWAVLAPVAVAGTLNGWC